MVWGLSLRKWCLSRDLTREKEEVEGGAGGLPALKTQKMQKELSLQTQGRDPRRRHRAAQGSDHSTVLEVRPQE